jgi:C-terminal processing protease CtpA/Prc
LQSMPATYTKLTYGASQDVVTSSNGRLAAIQIGKYSFANCTALIKNTTKGSYMGTNRSGVVGNQILSRFNAVYDFMGKKLYLSPSKKFAAPFIAQANGMMVEYAGENNNRILVKIVNPNSPASKAGIKEGDEILQLNGEKISAVGLQSFMQQINIVGKQINLLIKTASGENKTVSFTTEDII